jgi:hypothetical protein
MRNISFRYPLNNMYQVQSSKFNRCSQNNNFFPTGALVSVQFKQGQDIVLVLLTSDKQPSDSYVSKSQQVLTVYNLPKHQSFKTVQEKK